MQEDTNPEPGTTEAIERELCPQCLRGNRFGTHFCNECGAPLSAYAATGPFERLFAEGNAYRRAVEQPPRLVVVLGVWLIFGIGAVAELGLVFGNPNLASTALATVVAVFSAFIVIKTTVSYCRRRGRV